MSQVLQNILGNAAIMPDTADSWSPDTAYQKSIWVKHGNQNWTSRRPTAAGEEPGISGAWLAGPKGPYLGSQNWMLARDIENFEDGCLKWVNNADGTGIVTIKQSMLLRVWCQGGGGGGGGGWLGKGSIACGGGASGNTTMKTFWLSEGTTIPITIGQGGAGGVGKVVTELLWTSGTSGGLSSFGSLLAAGGGMGGSGRNQNNDGVNVMETGGFHYWSPPADILCLQNAGGTGLASVIHNTGDSVQFFSGMGGSSPFGKGGIFVPTDRWNMPNSRTGGNGAGYGSAGAGGAASHTTCNGGKGAPGCIFIERIA